MFQSNI